MSDRCIVCGQTLGRNDIGLHKKLIERSEEKNFLCKACIADKLRCDPALLDEKVKQFREAGCLLFAD